MRRTAFNDGWAVRPKGNRFAEGSRVGGEWTPVTLPHDAVIGTARSPSATAPTGYFGGGTWQYKKQFELAADADASITLEFEGVYRDAFVFVNGNLACHRPYGYSPFAVPIDHLLRYGGSNEVEVEARAHHDSRWYSGAGIYRNVWLLRAGHVHLAPGRLTVATPEIDDDIAALVIEADVRNLSAQPSRVILGLEITNASGDLIAWGEAPLTATPGETVTARQRLYVRAPRRWRLDDPHLYSCRASLRRDGEVVDEEVTTFGIRSLSLDPVRGLQINGEPVLLRGACVHHDNGVLGSATIDRADERRVELLKDAGFNAIRSAHNPLSDAMVAACDRLGVVVMDEAFDTWTQAKSEDDFALRFDRWWEDVVETMVQRDRNHPSVVFYSIGNEIPEVGGPQGAARGRALAAKVASLDHSRYVTQALSGLLVGGDELFARLGQELQGPAPDEADSPGEEGGVNTTMTRLADVLSNLMLSPVVAEKSEETLSYLDVAGYNYMERRLVSDGTLYPNRVIVSTETHAPTIDVGWAAVTDASHVIGDFTWTGWDYLGEAGIGRVEFGDAPVEGGMSSFLGAFPWLTAWCGDIDITGHRRPQSYFREIVFGRRTEPYIAVGRPGHRGQVVVHSSPWSWTDVVSSWSWDSQTGTPLTVEVYADGDEVELFLNDRSLGTRPVGSPHGFRAEFEVAFAAGSLEAVVRRGGDEVGRTSLRSATGPVQLTVHADRTDLVAGTSDLAFVELTLVDEVGTSCVAADRRVTVETEGPGKIQGLGSANPITREPFTGTACTTFEGRALAVVRPTGDGVITLTATAEGCAPRQVHINVRR